MSIKNLIYALVCVLSFSAVLAEKPNNQPAQQEQWGKFIQKLGVSVALGSLIGAVEGKLCFEGDKHFPFFIPWFVLNAARHGALRASENAMKENNISYDVNLLYNTAWIASWVSYISLWKKAQQVSALYTIIIDIDGVRHWLNV